MKLLRLIVATGAISAAAPAFACASCGCTLTSDWLSQGLVAQPGTTFTLRYDYIPQTQLRSGSHVLDRSKINLPADREIERYSYNHYVTASVDRQFNSDWGLNVQLPFIYRPHATVSEGDVDRSYSHTKGIGDLRITVRWQGIKTKGSVTGIQFGLVAPTGQFHQTFRSGPQKSEEVDRGLQPGTGTVQAVVGIYNYGKLAKNLDYILQLQGQTPLDSRDLYRPGRSAQVSAGAHFTRWRGITPQLELSVQVSERDHGLNADRENSGGVQVHAAPGVIASLGGGVSAFAFVELPLYQHVNGFQLTPHYKASIGIQYRL